MKGWDRLASWEGGAGWKAGTSVHLSPVTVDVYRPPKDWPVRKAIPPSIHLILPGTNIRELKAASSLREKQSKWNGEGDRGRQAGTSDGWKGRQTGWRADDANSHKCLSKNGHATAGWEHGKKSRPLPLSREHHDHVHVDEQIEMYNCKEVHQPFLLLPSFVPR